MVRKIEIVLLIRNYIIILILGQIQMVQAHIPPRQQAAVSILA